MEYLYKLQFQPTLAVLKHMDKSIAIIFSTDSCPAELLKEDK